MCYCMLEHFTIFSCLQPVGEQTMALSLSDTLRPLVQLCMSRLLVKPISGLQVPSKPLLNEGIKVGPILNQGLLISGDQTVETNLCFDL